MLRHFLLGKIHRATVTRADLDYVGSITIDVDLIEAAGFLENEKIDIYDVTNGARLSTYVIPGKRGSGEIGINGAAAHLVKPGDLVIIANYGWMTEQEAALRTPNVVHVDAKNRIVELAHEERTPVARSSRARSRKRTLSARARATPPSRPYLVRRAGRARWLLLSSARSEEVTVMAKSVFFFGDGTARGRSEAARSARRQRRRARRDDGARAPRPARVHHLDRGLQRLRGRRSACPDAVRAEVDGGPRAPREARWAHASATPAAPLLVSVRSGARASMPGMMDTILNLGLNDAVAEGLAARTKNPRFALRRVPPLRRDAREHRARRLEGAVRPRARRGARAASPRREGIDRTRLNAEELKRERPRLGHPRPRSCKALVTTLQGHREEGDRASDFPTDPREQLWQAIEAVFNSWNNHRAIVYRRMHDIPDDWGTACNVQAMVFGNLGDTSATGVAFTRDPSTGEKKLYGEWLPERAGRGRRRRHPHAAAHPLAARGAAGRTSRSRRRCPRRTASSSRIAATLEKHFRDMQDLEFTIQGGKLYMLQCRGGEARGARRRARRGRHGRARGSSRRKRPCCASTPAASTSSSTRRSIRTAPKKRPRARPRRRAPARRAATSSSAPTRPSAAPGQGKPVILVRVETSPEDIHGMKAARGILTARGGMTSHAAVVARGMGKPCVAGRERGRRELRDADDDHHRLRRRRAARPRTSR